MKGILLVREREVILGLLHSSAPACAAQAFKWPLKETPSLSIFHRPLRLLPPLLVHHPPHTIKHGCPMAGIQQGVEREGEGEGGGGCALNCSQAPHSWFTSITVIAAAATTLPDFRGA